MSKRPIDCGAALQEQIKAFIAKEARERPSELRENCARLDRALGVRGGSTLERFNV